MNRSFIFSSNSIKLSWKNWIMVIVILVGMFYFFPKCWTALEKFNPVQDYRLPYDLSNDYWMFNRWSKKASSQHQVVVIGDSVIWGQYVKREYTLSHCLNELAEKDMIANMGVDALHPAAMSGLLQYYGKAISNKGVILHFNPLWMSSKKQDLQGEKEFRFNHPRLVPQLLPNLSCYRPSFAERIGIVTERNIPFFSWISHIRIAYLENMNIENWTIQNPYKNPLGAITQGIPMPENKDMSKPVSWIERGMKKQNFPWMNVGESFQWGSFKKVIKILKSRNNKVFVLAGPFNPYILTEESLTRYNTMKDEVKKCLRENEVSYYSVPDLPSKYYADASHPLKKGYVKIAEELFKNKSFQKWMKEVK